MNRRLKFPGPSLLRTCAAHQRPGGSRRGVKELRRRRLPVGGSTAGLQRRALTAHVSWCEWSETTTRFYPTAMGRRRRTPTMFDQRGGALPSAIRPRGRNTSPDDTGHHRTPQKPPEPLVEAAHGHHEAETGPLPAGAAGAGTSYTHPQALPWLVPQVQGHRGVHIGMRHSVMTDRAMQEAPRHVTSAPPLVGACTGPRPQCGIAWSA